MIYHDSSDVKVSTAGILVKTGRKWQAQEVVGRVEPRLWQSILVGTVAMGQVGLGNFPKPHYDKACRSVN